MKSLDEIYEVIGKKFLNELKELHPETPIYGKFSLNYTIKKGRRFSPFSKKLLEIKKPDIDIAGYYHNIVILYEESIRDEVEQIGKNIYGELKMEKMIFELFDYKSYKILLYEPKHYTKYYADSIWPLN